MLKSIAKFLVAPAAVVGLLLVVGAGLAVLAVVGEEQHWCTDAARIAAPALLSGGAFMAVVKSIQFAGVFRDEICRAMDSREETSTARWSNLTAALLPPGLPRKTRDAATAHLGFAIGADKDRTAATAYYEALSMAYKIEPVPDDNELYRATLTCSMLVKPAAPASAIPFRYSWTEATHPGQTHKIEIFVDGELIPVKEEVRDGKFRTEASFMLTGKESYQVRRDQTLVSAFTTEPWIRSTFARLIHGLFLKVEAADPIVADVFGFGLGPEIGEIKSGSYQSDGVLLPGQGFIIRIRRRGN